MIRRKGRKADRDPLVFAMRDMFEGAVVTIVFHESDGDWQYLTAPYPELADAQLVHQSHVYNTDPTLRELETMPSGFRATRDALGEQWILIEDRD